MSIDAIFLSIGELGKQQCIYGGLLCLLNGLAAFHMLQYTFVSFDVDFTCISSEKNYSNECPDNSVAACSDVFFSTQQRSSIVSEFGLVCDQSYKSKATMSAFMAGVMIGAFVLGKFADQYGRRICLGSTTLGVLVFNTLSALVPSYKLYLLTKFAVGFFQAGFILASFVLSNELVGPSKRGLVSMIFQSSFSLFIVILSLLAYHLQHWRRLTLIISVLGAPALALNLIVPESPRWLLSKNRKREALKVLRDIAAGNGSVFTEKMKLEIENNNHPGGGEKSGKHYEEGLLDLFRTLPLSLLTLTQIYSWFVNSGAYYGLTLAAGSAGGNLYTATALSGAVEIPAYVLANFLLNITGRRKILAGFMLVGGFSCLGIQVFSRVLPALVQSLALLGKLCLAASFAVIYIHSGEIFPTTIRNSGMGLMSVAARLGGIIAPFIVSLGQTSPNLQFTVFGLMSLTAGLLNLKLPETKGAQLPETVGDLMMRLQGGRITETKHNNLDMEASGLLSDQSDD